MLCTCNIRYRNELSRFRCASIVNAHTRQKILGTIETHWLLYNEEGLADDYHLLLVFKSIKSEREKYLAEEFYKYRNLLKLNKLMNLSCISKFFKNLSKVCKFITNFVLCKMLNLLFVSPSRATNMNSHSLVAWYDLNSSLLDFLSKLKLGRVDS